MFVLDIFNRSLFEMSYIENNGMKGCVTTPLYGVEITNDKSRNIVSKKLKI